MTKIPTVSTVVSTVLATSAVSFAMAGGDEGTILKAADMNCTRGQVAEVQIRATTHDLIGGFEFQADAVGYEVQDVRYDGPIFDTSWSGWDNAPANNVGVSAVCVFTEDQVDPGDHNLVTLEVPIPADAVPGTVIPVNLSNISFFNYDFSVATLDPRNGSITVHRTADLNGNGTVDPADLGLMIAQWGPANAKSTGDLDGSGEVDGADLGRLVERWGTEG